MSFFNQLTPDQQTEKYNAAGWFLLCPIWLEFKRDAPEVATRNWVPDWWFFVNMALFQIGQVLRVIFGFEEMDFPILVTENWERMT